MPDIEYWKQRARDAEQKLLDMGGKAKEGAKSAIEKGKARVGIDANEPTLPQLMPAPVGRAVDKTRELVGKGKDKAADLIDKGAAALDQGAAGARRGVDMGRTMAGENLDEPLLPQLPGGGAVQSGLGRAADAVSGLGGAAKEGAGDLKNLFLDKVLGTSGGQPPYMYQGAPAAPPSSPSMYDQGTPPAPPPSYMYNDPNPAMTVGPTSANPQPWLNEQPPQPPPHMYQGATPDAPQSMYNVPDQGAMERALKAAEDAFNRAMGR